MNMEDWRIGTEMEGTGTNPDPFSLCPPQITHRRVEDKRVIQYCAEE